MQVESFERVETSSLHRAKIAFGRQIKCLSTLNYNPVTGTMKPMKELRVAGGSSFRGTGG